jgi:thymidylate synthase
MKHVSIPSDLIRQAWSEVLHGRFTSPRGHETLEVVNWSCTVRNPQVVPFTIPGRTGLFPFIGAVEALQLVGQTHAPELIMRRSPQLYSFTDRGIFDGGYGIRAFGQLGRVADLLTKDPDSRQAVVTIHNGNIDLLRETKDVPCTLSLQFMVRGGELCLRVTMRSNDVWLGLPYDVVQFTVLQLAMASALGIPVGWYHHSVGSLHLYERDRGKVEMALTDISLDNNTQLREPYWHGASWEAVSRTARNILVDDLDLDAATPLESTLNRLIWS